MKLYIQLASTHGWRTENLPALVFSKRRPVFDQLDEIAREVAAKKSRRRKKEDRDASFFIALSRAEEKKLAEHIGDFTGKLSKGLSQSALRSVLNSVLEHHYSMKVDGFRISTFPSDAQYSGQKPQIVFCSKQRLSL